MLWIREKVPLEVVHVSAAQLNTYSVIKQHVGTVTGYPNADIANVSSFQHCRHPLLLLVLFGGEGGRLLLLAEHQCSGDLVSLHTPAPL